MQKYAGDYKCEILLVLQISTFGYKLSGYTVHVTKPETQSPKQHESKNVHSNPEI